MNFVFVDVYFLNLLLNIPGICSGMKLSDFERVLLFLRLPSRFLGLVHINHCSGVNLPSLLMQYHI